MPSYASGKFQRASEGGTVSVQGFAALQRALRSMEDGVQAELTRRIREVGARVALVAASNAPRLEEPRTGSGFPGELQHSVKVSAFSRGASVYSTALYGGAQNVGAWSQGRGPHIKRARASHYMDKAVDQLSPWVEQQINLALDWLMTTFEEG